MTSSYTAVPQFVQHRQLRIGGQNAIFSQALRENRIQLETVKTDELPAEMQKMNAGERKAYVDGKAKQRAEIQQKIQELSQQRQKYVEQEMKKTANQPATLGAGITKTIREQARVKNFTFEDPNKAPESK